MPGGQRIGLAGLPVEQGTRALDEPDGLDVVGVVEFVHAAGGDGGLVEREPPHAVAAEDDALGDPVALGGPRHRDRYR